MTNLLKNNETNNTLTTEIITRITNDVNGNPRYVCHFLSLINKGDEIKADANEHDSGIDTKYNLALYKAHKIGGKKYHNKKYGGGIAFQSYNKADLIKGIKTLKEVNTNFKSELTRKEIKRLQRAIYTHFCYYTYKHQAEHGAPLKPLRPFNFNELNMLFGLAYTSSGDYAGLWVCNGGYVMANKSHHFTGFTMNKDGECIGIVEDEDENTIYLTL